MRHGLALLLTLTLTTPLLADAVEDVRQAEIGFAKAFADRDKERFFSYVAEDAVFLSALGTQRGKAQVIKAWSRFFDNTPVAPFRWGPERVEITANGTIGFSMGPIYDPRGQHAGYYSSIWQKQADGRWKVIVDGPGNPPAPVPENAVTVEEGFVAGDDGAKLYFRKMGRGPITLIAPLDFALHDSLRQFADIATVITYDLRGRAKSSKLETLESVSIQQDVRDLEAVRRHFNVEKFVPIGYSYLGKMVLLYAAAHPERVTRIVQLGPVGNTPIPPPQSLDFGAPAADLEAWGRLRKDPNTPGRDLCLAQWKVMSYYMVGDPKNAADFEYASMCELENEWPSRVNAVFGKLMPTIAEPMPQADIRKVTMPVLTIHGTADRNAGYEGGRTWAAELPDARLVTVPGAAHALWVDDPVTVWGALRHFLRGEWPLDAVRN
jgi:pimeloyl-ACP methyl ester carboxylesterase/ketosteroid isomerase-like protein